MSLVPEQWREINWYKKCALMLVSSQKVFKGVLFLLKIFLTDEEHNYEGQSRCAGFHNLPHEMAEIVQRRTIIKRMWLRFFNFLLT